MLLKNTPSSGKKEWIDKNESKTNGMKMKKKIKKDEIRRKIFLPNQLVFDSY